jgi:hypothetical protein
MGNPNTNTKKKKKKLKSSTSRAKEPGIKEVPRKTPRLMKKSRSKKEKIRFGVRFRNTT